jgi:acetylxylan esterase
MKTYLAILFLLAGTSHAIPASAPTADSCAPVHMIVARASGEAPGDGIIGSLAKRVQDEVTGSTQEALDYPASLTNYSDSFAVST